MKRIKQETLYGKNGILYILSEISGVELSEDDCMDELVIVGFSHAPYYNYCYNNDGI